ncbi:tetratricopeptide repeat protein [Streptomyces sp. NPDC048507]|uniref:tetratricopeptide repeat protein n=1 Tax=Streptomyces sp. NPDC048507 TaxID=3365560 RepID=UPI00371385E6
MRGVGDVQSSPDVGREALEELQARLADGLASSGLSVDFLARRAGLGRTTVSQALHQRKAPSERTVAALAKALKLDVTGMLELRRSAQGLPRIPPASSAEPLPPVPAVAVAERPGPGSGLLVGALPLTASAFQPRDSLRERIDAARTGGGAVLTQARPPSAQVLAGMGGVGKSQLAAHYAHQAVVDGTGLVLWVPAGDVQQIITLYGQAALRIGVAGATGEDPEQDARALVEWMATTGSSWLVVLDDVSDPVVVGPWWPPSRPGIGWTLATSRLHDPRLTGGGRTRIDVDVYSHAEAVAYLEERLTGDGCAHLLDDRQGQLAIALGHLPLALGHAAAYLLAENFSCDAYLARLNDQATELDEVLPDWADTELYGRQVTAALLLSVTAAVHAGPPGLVEPLLRLIALLAPEGHPQDLWTTKPVLELLGDAKERIPGTDTAAQDVQRALQVLRRYALIGFDPHSPYRQVRIHALTARAIRETTPRTERPALALLCADALSELWQEPLAIPRDLGQVLRANTSALRLHAEECLWQRNGHIVLFLNGESLRASGLQHEAHAYWALLSQQAAKALGKEHPNTLTTRINLATTFNDLGRHQDALTLREQVRTDSERLLGHDHPATLVARTNLAATYSALGNYGDALALQEEVLTDCKRLLGEDHRETLLARANLATTYGGLGRHHDALALQERVLAETEHIRGHDHPDTLIARANLATTYSHLGRHHDAFRLEEQVLADRERLLGHDHPHTLMARANLAATYWDLGRRNESVTLEEQVLADRERLLGHDHPDTLVARTNLAATYSGLGRHHDAFRLQEAVLTDCERLLHEDHPETLSARANLAATYCDLGRHHEALTLQEQVLADRERLLGHDHLHTLSARADLATSYWDLGRHHEALTLEEQVLAETERICGHDHPYALIARTNRAAMYRELARLDDALRFEPDEHPNSGSR